MDLKKLLKLVQGYGVIIKHSYSGEILYQGEAKDVPENVLKDPWLVLEARLTDVKNYNSDYILTVY